MLRLLIDTELVIIFYSQLHRTGLQYTYDAALLTVTSSSNVRHYFSIDFV